jgi:hypothetical protein
VVRDFGTIVNMRWALVLLTLAASVSASSNLDVLVNAASSFSVTISQQLQMLHSNPSPAVFAEKTIDYAEAKTAYFEALRAALPILTSSSEGEEERSLEIAKFAAALAVSGEAQAKAADNETSAFFARFSREPRVEKARESFDRAQKAERTLRKELDRLGLGGE